MTKSAADEAREIVEQWFDPNDPAERSQYFDLLKSITAALASKNEEIEAGIKREGALVKSLMAAEARLAEARKVIEAARKHIDPVVQFKLVEAMDAILSTPSPEPSKDGAITPSELGTLRKHSRDVSECHRILNKFGLPRGDGLPDRLRSFLGTKNAKAIDAE